MGGVTRRVKNRWYRGYRDPEKLLQNEKLPRKFYGVHTLVYEGVEYPSLKEFCRFFDLNYRKALTLWKKNVRDPEIIKEKADFQDNREILKTVSEDDHSNIEKVVNNYGYLTSWQVAERTGMSGIKIRDQVNRMLANQGNNMGVLKNDIKKMSYSDKDRAMIAKNAEVLPNYVFKPQVVDHIKQHLSKIDKETVKLIPFFNNNYYFDEDKKVILSKGRGSTVLKELTPSGHTYTFRDDKGKRYGFTVETIKDLIANPKIKAENLITKAEIIKKYGLTPAIWNNRAIYSILPLKIGHTRYSKDGKLVKGWTKEIVDQVVSNYPDKFKSKSSKKS